MQFALVAGFIDKVLQLRDFNERWHRYQDEGECGQKAEYDFFHAVGFSKVIDSTCMPLSLDVVIAVKQCDAKCHVYHGAHQMPGFTFAVTEGPTKHGMHVRGWVHGIT